MPTGSPSTSDIYDVGLVALQTRQPALVVRPGDVTDSFIFGGAAMAGVIIGSSAKGFRSTLVLGARGADLTLVCHDRGVDRDTGDFSIGSVTFTRPAVGSAGTITQGTRVATQPSTVDGSIVIFMTDSDLGFLAGDLTKSVTCTCTVVGKSGNVDPGDVERIMDVPVFDATFTVTNPIKFAGGNEAQSDSDLQAATQRFPLVLRRGTVDALQYGAKLTPGVRRASVVVAGPNMVLVYVCDVDGNSNPTLAAAAQAIIDGPPAWRGASDIVTCIGSDLFTQDFVFSVALRAGANPNVVFPKITAAVAGRLSQLDPGAPMPRSIVSTAAENADTSSIAAVTLISPVTDIVPLASQAIRMGTATYQ